MVSVVLPESVKAKCKIFGTDWERELRADLTPEAYAWVVAPAAELIRAPLPLVPAEAAAEPQPAAAAAAHDRA